MSTDDCIVVNDRCEILRHIKQSGVQRFMICLQPDIETLNVYNRNKMYDNDTINGAIRHPDNIKQSIMLSILPYITPQYIRVQTRVASKHTLNYNLDIECKNIDTLIDCSEQMFNSMEQINNAAKSIAMLNRTALPPRLHTFPSNKSVSFDNADYKVGDDVFKYPLDQYKYVNRSAEIAVKLTSVFKNVSVVFDVDFDSFHTYYHNSLRTFNAYDELYSNNILTMILNSNNVLLKSCDNFESDVLSKYVMTILEVNSDARKFIPDMIKSCVSGRNKTTLFMILDKYPVTQLKLNEILYDIGKQFTDRDTIVDFVYRYMCSSNGYKPQQVVPKETVESTNQQNLTSSSQIKKRLAMLDDASDSFGINLLKK